MSKWQTYRTNNSRIIPNSWVNINRFNLNQNSDFNIAEIFQYNRILNIDEIEQTKIYLNDKYNLQGNEQFIQAFGN